ncbi:MAG: hypothetical protein ACREF5_02600 [Candidatus Saccharimonadales bacterium]
MASSKDKPKVSKVIDVTEPGKSEPSTSSRAIIVTNRPIMKQDPMVMPNETAQDDVLKSSNMATKIEPLESKPGTKTATIAPSLPKKIADTKRNEEATDDATDKGKVISVAINKPAPPDEKLEKVVPTEEVTEPVSKDEPKPEIEPVIEKTPETTTEVAPAEDIDNKTESDKERIEPNKVVDEAEKKEEAAKIAKLAELEKIIDSKKYFLPINSVEHRKDTRQAISVLILVILLALVWLDLILDAGLIRLGGIHAVTNFFRSSP